MQWFGGGRNSLTRGLRPTSKFRAPLEARGIKRRSFVMQPPNIAEPSHGASPTADNLVHGCLCATGDCPKISRSSFCQALKASKSIETKGHGVWDCMLSSDSRSLVVPAAKCTSTLTAQDPHFATEEPRLPVHSKFPASWVS